MSLTLEQVRRVAQLARIEISDDEANSTLAQLNSIFALIEEMQSVDTQGIEPMAHAQEMMQRLRDDLPDARDSGERRAAFQAIAPETAEGLYLVPKVIE
ncbi:MAG TPA: Asp-tRNA(Asn)/Glu-tRNA(Gln) amidotransferase subunit GatC [Accumulibacter sp.]|jgi:aspartyl-tRNA(Asn)/glutamyl-tRNA(Gln) amidotransferase subunit C|nr:Asp-tRNA(Asn)/Glu-tRNA(Gln) amidotransferase subunit GatC [Accumulibacter sp.]HPP47828.1 Asp-tRNA(Asn)/Glu-tRNA(Gln) amidotransferase subunit GatC [Accumulibacter sp.]